MTDPLIAAAQFLSAQLDWLRHARDEMGQPYAASVFAEIRDCASRMRGVVEGPADRRYLGPCGATWDIGTLEDRDQTLTCEGDVYARDGAPAGRCNICKAEYPRAERQDWIDTLRRDWLYHASEITEAYPEIKANTVSKWYSRGLLASHGEHEGRPLFKVGEVLDLAASDAARREQARARRAAARKTAEMGA